MTKTIQDFMTVKDAIEKLTELAKQHGENSPFCVQAGAMMSGLIGNVTIKEENGCICVMRGPYTKGGFENSPPPMS